jgi:hypothetical protein
VTDYNGNVKVQKPIELPERFRDERPYPDAFARFEQVMAALVAVPKTKALAKVAFHKALKKSKVKSTRKRI